MSESNQWPDPIVQAAEKVAEALNADVLLFNSEITRDGASYIEDSVGGRRRRANIFAIMTTPGGDMDAAYIIARCFQRRYQHFVACISGACKSAGTLAVVGANELVIDDHGELGPLDVQIRKPDELFDRASALIDSNALDALASEACDTWHKLTYKIMDRTGYKISFKVAANMAIKMTTGLLCPVYARIDPMHVGEVHRSMNITKAYAERLTTNSRLIKSSDCLNYLLKRYPDHGFVIDREEALRLFTSVREPSTLEVDLLRSLGTYARNAVDEAVISFISAEVPATAVSTAGGNQEPNGKRDAGIDLNKLPVDPLPHPAHHVRN